MKPDRQPVLLAGARNYHVVCRQQQRLPELSHVGTPHATAHHHLTKRTALSAGGGDDVREHRPVVHGRAGPARREEAVKPTRA